MKKIFMFCLMLCFVAPIAIRAEKKPFGNGLYWELNDDGVLRISGNGYMSRLEIESIRPWKLSRKEIKKIFISEGVCSIGFGAFYDSSVEYVELPNTIEWIGDNAFGLCNMLKTINLPSSLKSIGNSAFRGCTKLTSVIIPNTVISIGHGAFSSCSNLSSITLSTSLTTIEDGTFANSGLSSIYLPNSITSIGEVAFYGCHYLSSVFLSYSLKSISSKAFADCNRLNQIAIPSNVKTIEIDAFDKGTMLVKDQESRLLLDAKQGRFLWEAKQGKYKKLSDDAPVACYLVEEGLYRGVLSLDGNWIIPLNKNNLTILYAGGSYIKVRKTDGYGITSFEGQEIIPSNRNYTSISDFNEKNKTFTFTKIGIGGICNAMGEVIATKKIPLTDSDVKQKGGYASVVEMKNGSTKYYKVSKGGRYGLTDSEGKEIVPCEMEALESAGTGYLKYKINGFWGLMNYTGKILIGTERGYTSIGDFKTFNKRFPYTMAGYKGECDINGRQVSKIKVETQKQAVTYSSSPKYKDALVFDLKGSVKETEHWAFDTTGKLKHDKYELVRDSQNRLISMKSTAISQSKSTFEYDEKGRLIAETTELSGITVKDTHTYNNKGMISKTVRVVDGKTSVYLYSDYIIDSYGNWTSRKVNSTGIETRHIEYY